MVQLETDTVIFDNGCQVKLPEPIPGDGAGYIRQYCGFVFIINNTVSPNNIWCFDQEGNKLWEIEASIWDSPYHDITLVEDNQVRACDQRGDTYVIDINTGYVEWIGGDRGGDTKGANEFIRKRREERLNKA